MRWMRPGTALVMMWLVTGVALAEVPPMQGVHISGIPHIQQKPDFCGEACVAMYCDKLGISINQNDVFNAANLDPALGRGCWARELREAVEHLGFSPGPVWFYVKIGSSDPQGRKQLDRLFSRVHAELRAGYPSIVCMRYGFSSGATEHFRLITGYDTAKDEVIYHEPAAANGKDRRMSRSDFLKLWPLKYRKDRWTVVMFSMRATDQIQSLSGSNAPHSDADYAQHVHALKKKLPNGFSIVISKPFVVIGDEPLETVKARAQRTVEWAVRRLKQAYFAKDPERILDIYLFKDKASYEKHCRRMFGITPHTPFGFYSDSQGALIMNIATGGGTLVHEIVHPFVEANFPQCPAWFNEGLGSLYEQCGEDRSGRIVGRTNWRLAGLQNAIRARSVPSFKTLTHTTTHQFYRQDPGTNYAQARYLCYYLQQRGLLRKYYHAFVKNAANDPTGYKTLGEMLNVKDWDQFKQDWEKWVLALRYP